VREQDPSYFLDLQAEQVVRVGDKRRDGSAHEKRIASPRMPEAQGGVFRVAVDIHGTGRLWQLLVSLPRHRAWRKVD